MLEITYRVVQDGCFIGYVLAFCREAAERMAYEKFGANCLVDKLLV
jgi:hypothetical protein